MANNIVEFSIVRIPAEGGVKVEPISCKICTDNRVKEIKKQMKKLGYKYKGRDRDMYDNIFTKYIKLSEILPEEKVFYKYQITRLKQTNMEKTITLTGGEIYNITSAINDRIILLEECISSHDDTPITHKRLKEFKEIKAKLNN